MRVVVMSEPLRMGSDSRSGDNAALHASVFPAIARVILYLRYDH
jgi:hypothetical protein